MPALVHFIKKYGELYELQKSKDTKGEKVVTQELIKSAKLTLKDMEDLKIIRAVGNNKVAVGMEGVGGGNMSKV